MTVLAQLADGLISVQCDVCTPPNLTINTPAELRRTGWVIGGAIDTCANCAANISARNRQPRGDASPTAPDPARLPNIVVIGASKAGTTSMLNYLGVHPEIAVSTEKEMRFFQDPDYRSWLGIYQAYFPVGTRYRAEATPFYSQTPSYPGVADRMADLVPDAKLLYLVRDPIDRIIAEYVEQVQWRAAGATLEERLVSLADPRNYLVAASRYATQLREYQRRFAADQVMVLDLADLAADVVGVMAEVFDFLGLERPAMSPEDFGVFNTRDEKRQFPEWLIRLRRGPIVRAMHKLPERPRRFMSDLAWRRLRTPVERPELSEDTRRALQDVLAPEVADLRALTGREFATWSV
jgi:sulfotransferase family protein